MRRSKQQPDLLDRMLKNFSIRGFLLHQGTLFVVASLIVIAGIAFLWENFQSTIVDPKSYQLTKDNIEINEPPSWVDTDLRTLIVGDDLQRSILDPHLVSETAMKIQTVGFVERVNQIVKSRTGLKVDLQYRHPVALVEMSEVTFRKRWREGAEPIFLPVDRLGVLMPRDIDYDPNLPKLCMLYPAGTSPDLTTWADIDDSRIRDGAAIAQYFANDAKRIGIARIVTHRSPENAEDKSPFELWPANGDRGTIVIWGQLPGEEGPSEAPLEQKLVALENYVQQFGSLDTPRGIKIDIQTGSVVVVPKNKVADLNSPFEADHR